MTLKRLLLLAGVLFSFNGYLMSQTTLNAGDLAIIGMNGQFANDQFTFVCFVDLEPGTVIYFADVPADGDLTHPAPGFNDAVVTYTAPAGGVEAGTVVNWATPSSGDFAVAASGGGSNDIFFTNNGDKVVAFQGTSASNVDRYLFAIANQASYGTFPGGFSETVNFGTNEDGQYTGIRNSIHDSLFSYIKDTDNWNFVNGTSQALPQNTTEFRIGYYYDGTWEPENPEGPNGGDAGDNDIIIAEPGASFSTGSVTTTGDVYIDSTGTLDIGANQLTADTVFVESDENGQGQVKGDIVGTVQFQSYVSAGSARWFSLGSPVGGTLADMEFTNGGMIRTMAEIDSASVNIYWYNTDMLNNDNGEGTWLPVASKTALADTTGYSVYLGGGGPFGTFPMKVITHGTLNHGNFSTDISTANGGYNHVNNPYATSLDFFELAENDNNSLNKNYWISDGAGGFTTYNAESDIPTDRRFIAAGQSFFVNTTSPTSLNFEADQQDMTQSPALVSTQPSPGIYLEAQNSQGNMDYAYVGLKSGLSDSYDTRLDGKKMMNNSNARPNFYSVLQGEEYVFKFIDDNFSKRQVPMSFDYGQNEQLTISAQLQNIDPIWFVHLEDKLTGQFTNLRYDSYTFTHDKTNNPDRFVLHLNQSGVGLDEMGKNDVFAYLENGNLQVNLEDLPGTKSYDVQLYDVSGRMIEERSFNGGQTSTMNFEQRSNGVYVMKVLGDGDLVHTQKVMNY